MPAVATRYDLVVYFDVTDGNPNGDPDNDGAPRQDPKTKQGLVSDVCDKRKIRNVITLVTGGADPLVTETRYGIHVAEGAILELAQEEAYRRTGFASEIASALDEEAEARVREESATASNGRPAPKKKPRRGRAEAREAAQAWMCAHYWDIRSLGGMLVNKSASCGQVRGPVQIGFARSIDPIQIIEHAITRVAITREETSIARGGLNQAFGRKTTVPYGLYRFTGHVEPYMALRTGFDDVDLELLWAAIGQMFEHDHSASRGEMALRGLYVFRHDSMLGNAPAYRLFERIRVTKRPDVQFPRAFRDYEVLVDGADLPHGVTLIDMTETAPRAMARLLPLLGSLAPAID